MNRPLGEECPKRCRNVAARFQRAITDTLKAFADAISAKRTESIYK